MGWLRELMDRSPARIRSFGALARAALAHPNWPPTVAPRERSLAALFSKLDYGSDLAWLGDRPEVQGVLAELCGVSTDAFRGALGPRLGASDEDRHVVRWVDAPFAAPLRLTDEPLPPGIPEFVGRPASFGAHYWPAVSGAGRTLSGRWLRARGLATFGTARTYREGLSELSGPGPHFLELQEPLPEDAVPPATALLVAAPPAAGKPPRLFQEIHTAETRSWLPDLVAWLGRRLPADGRFDPDVALRLLFRAHGDGLIDSFGSALGMASVVDAFEGAALDGVDLGQIAEWFVEAHLTGKHDQSNPSRPTLAPGTGHSLLVALGGRLLTQPGAWDAPRTLEQWVGLVPRELHETVDAEWVRVTLGRAASPVTVRELERPLSELPPGGFRLIQALERGGLLREKTPGESTLAPRWLALHVIERARAATARGLPEEWGEALLDERGAPAMARRIYERALEADETLLDDALETDGASGPGAAAAIEMTMRVAGLALLVADDGADDAHALLWDQALSLVHEGTEGPQPRVDYEAGDSPRDPLLHVGTYRLAALALSEGLPQHRGPKHPLLRPWSDPPPEPAWLRLLDSVGEAISLSDPELDTWIPGAFALIGRLRTLHPTDRPVHPLEWPAETTRALLKGRLTWSAWKEGATPMNVRALEVAAGDVGIAREAVARSVWRAWLESAEVIDEHSPLWPLAEPGRSLFRHAPPGAMEAIVDGHLMPIEVIPFEHLTGDAWPALHSRAERLLHVGGAWTALPDPTFFRALRLAAESGASLAQAWAAAGARLLGALPGLLEDDRRTAIHIVCEAPETAMGELAPHLVHLAEHATTDEARRLAPFLHGQIRRRAPGFREAFAALAALR